jgi:hypothetical protein
MTMKLSDTQLVILSAACARADGAVFPITASLKGGALQKVLQSLIAKGVVEEIPAAAHEAAWRLDDDGVRLTLRATQIAREALGINDDDDPTPPSGGASRSAKPKRGGEAPADVGDVAATRGRRGKAAGVGAGKANSGSTAAAKAEEGQPRTGTKQALLISMLKRKEGATVEEIVGATGWQAHTVRGAMAGALKKRLGLAIDSEKVEGRGRVYRIA